MQRTYQRALITGATSGIGEAFVEVLPEATELLITGQNAAKLADMKKKFTTKGRKVAIVEANLRSKEDRKTLIRLAEEKEIDLLINNAGLGFFSHFIENSPNDEEAMVDVNVVAVHALTHALIPGMLQRAKYTNHRAGLIIVSSVVGHLPLPYFATYAATKAFGLALAEGLAEELSGAPIDILALCPGATKTDFHSRAGAPTAMYNRAESSISVAEKGIRALGRRRVLLSQLPLRLGLSYNIVLHRIASLGAHAYFKHLIRGDDKY